jgi:hypothetical protein
MRLTRDKIQPLLQALEAYLTDNNAYPPADTLDQLLPMLEPDYLPAGFDTTDAWGQPLRYQSLRISPAGPAIRYRLGSAGDDGYWRYESMWLYQSRWLETPSEELIFENGGMLTRFSDPDESVHDRYFESARALFLSGTALESYNTDYNHYPAGDSMEEALSNLQPYYLFSPFTQGFASLDAWRHAYRYESWSSTGGPYADHYCVGSSGVDRVWEHPSLREYGYRDVLSYDDDLILCDGAWLQLVDDPDLTPAQRYKTCLGAIKTLGTAVESYFVDSNSYPPDATLDQMLTNLTNGGYISGPIERWRLDGWRVPMRYQPMSCAGQICSGYRLASAAADNQWEYPDLLPYTAGDNATLSQDIVLDRGQFLRACPDINQCPVSSSWLKDPALHPPHLTSPTEPDRPVISRRAEKP